MTLQHHLEKSLLKRVESLSGVINPLTPKLVDNYGFFLFLAVLSSICALMSVAHSIGNLSRFL